MTVVGGCELEQPDVHMMLGPGYAHLSHESLRQCPQLGSVSCIVRPHVAWENARSV